MSDRNTLICTVGTSLFSNIAQPNQAELKALLEQAQRNDHWDALVAKLRELDPLARVLGAEINSIEDTYKRKFSDLRHLYFLVSDTEAGKQTGKLLKAYYELRSMDGSLPLETVEHIVIEKLQDAEPIDFKRHGLRNLVRKAGAIINGRTPQTVVINATGGYKAQIAIAVVLGQALEIPVLYRHEQFSEIIDFPPMPISFDYRLLGENAALLSAFERGEAFAASEIDDIDDKLRVLLEEVDVDGEMMYELSAVGQIFLLGFRERVRKPSELAPVSAEAKLPPTFRDDHYPIGFKEFVEKVCRETGWIKTAHSLPYHNQKSIKGIGFYVRKGKLIGTYVDKDRFGARFEVLTNASSDEAFAWAADQLNQTYSQG